MLARPPLMLFAALAGVIGVATTAEAQKTHRITLEADRDKEVYKFTPSQVTAVPGDVLVFETVSGAPHSIVFESKGLSPATHRALNAALHRRSGDLTSPVLTKEAAYRVVIPNLPAGTYAYFCLPHRAYDMRGEIVVKK